MRIKLVILSFVIIALVNVSAVFALDVQVGDVKDSRTTGQFFKGLDVELKIIGEGLNDAKAIRTDVKSATDSTGKDLINKEESKKGFEELSSYGGEVNNTITLKLLNPARSADKIKEIAGHIELYVPKNDPNSTVLLKGLKGNTGKVVDHPAIKGAGVELEIYTSDQYEAQKKKDQEKRLQEMKAQGATPDQIEMAVSMMEAFGGGSDENSIIMKTKDPSEKIIAIELQNAKGEKIDTNGSMSSGDTKTLYLNQKLPEDTNILIRLASDKAVVKLPLQMANITLP